MNFKHNINYFKSGEITKIIGIILMALAVPLYFFGWGYISYILMSISLPVGALLFILGTGRRSSDGDIDEYIKRTASGLEIDLIEDKDFAKKLDKSFSPMIFEGYEYDDGLMFTKSKVGSVRSSKYTKSVVYVLHGTLYILKRSFSLVADEIENTNYEFNFTEVDRVELTEIEKNLVYEKKNFRVRFTRLNIVCGDNMILSLPAPNDVSAEKIVEKLNLTLKKAREEK